MGTNLLAGRDFNEHDRGSSMYAAIRKDESALIESVLRHGANAKGTLPSGPRPSTQPQFGGATTVVVVLLKNGADPNMSDRK
jgi:hypothetical protein